MARFSARCKLNLTIELQLYIRSHGQVRDDTTSDSVEIYVGEHVKSVGTMADFVKFIKTGKIECNNRISQAEDTVSPLQDGTTSITLLQIETEFGLTEDKEDIEQIETLLQLRQKECLLVRTNLDFCFSSYVKLNSKLVCGQLFF